MTQLTDGTKAKLLFATVMACIVALGTAYFVILRTNAAIAESSHRTRQLINTISLLESQIGYGGFIHNFKNAVLRRNGDYIEAARRDYHAALDSLARIRELAALEGFRPNLASLERTLAQYADHLERLPALIDQGLGSQEIDEIVWVIDGEAVASLQEFVVRAHAQVERLVQRYVRTSNLMGGLSFLVIVLLLLSLSLIARTAFLNRMARSARETMHLAETKSLADRMFACEMLHRINNLMAAIQSINRQTLRTSVSAKDHSNTLAGRLNAMSVAQNLAVEHSSEIVNLTDLIGKLAAPYQNGPNRPPRVRCDGVDLKMHETLATQVSLIFHELLTNAAKYGALSVGGGRIVIDCRDAAPGRFCVVWTEIGGPPTARPDFAGFGTRFIHQVVEMQMKGTCGFHFRRAGLQVRLDFPLDQPARRHLVRSETS